jgi:hypothetical protein
MPHEHAVLLELLQPADMGAEVASGPIEETY